MPDPRAHFESNPRLKTEKSTLILADYLEKIPRDYRDGQQRWSSLQLRSNEMSSGVSMTTLGRLSATPAPI
jgi:hypothetical protein